MSKIISDTISARERFKAGCWVHSDWGRGGSGWSGGGLCMRDPSHRRGKSGFLAEGAQKPSEHPTYDRLFNLSDLQFFVLKNRHSNDKVTPDYLLCVRLCSKCLLQ